MQKFLTALIWIPLGAIFLVFAVSNRHPVRVSLDPFNSDPQLGVTMPLFALIIGVAILGVLAGGIATWIRQRRWRRSHEGIRPMRSRRARNWPSFAPASHPRQLPATACPAYWNVVPVRPASATNTARRCRTAACVGKTQFHLQTMLRAHARCRENLWPVHARNAGRRATGRRRHGGIRELSRLAPSCRSAFDD